MLGELPFGEIGQEEALVSPLTGGERGAGADQAMFQEQPAVEPLDAAEQSGIRAPAMIEGACCEIGGPTGRWSACGSRVREVGTNVVRC
ncbi:MAG TPA: hypothetical protein VNZ57_00025 [Longimicrobiales bacterium]|nr:hypothetical protein [Longimicrobiales bacterium]